MPARTERLPSEGGPVRLNVRGLNLELGRGTARSRILHDVDLQVPRGQTIGVVGESGSGKSTLAKAIVGQYPVASGSIELDGLSIVGLRGRELADLRRKVQLIPQDPYSSLDPRRTVGEALAEAIDPRGASVRRHRTTIVDWLERVVLEPEAIDRYPHEFSGGQRQRIAIARALSLGPELIIADEITSALDLTTQAEILNLLSDLREQMGLTMVFISHNLAVVRHVSDEVVVMLHGVIVETGTEARIFDEPEHPYTRTLLASVPGSPGFCLTDT